MKTNFDAEIKNYLNNISRMIPKKYPNKKLLLNNIKNNLELYFQEHPLSSWKDALTEFGSETEIIESVMSEFSGTEITISLHRKKWQHVLIFCTCIIIFISILLLGYAYYYEHYNKPHINETHYIYNGTETSSEEFDEKMNHN